MAAELFQDGTPGTAPPFFEEAFRKRKNHVIIAVQIYVIYGG